MRLLYIIVNKTRIQKGKKTFFYASFLSHYHRSNETFASGIYINKYKRHTCRTYAYTIRRIYRRKECPDSMCTLSKLEHCWVMATYPTHHRGKIPPFFNNITMTKISGPFVMNFDKYIYINSTVLELYFTILMVICLFGLRIPFIYEQ